MRNLKWREITPVQDRERREARLSLAGFGSVAMLLQGAREREKEWKEEGRERKSGEGG